MVLNILKVALGAALAAGLLLTGLALADDRTDAIAERIAPVARICMAGEDCPTAAAQGATSTAVVGGSQAAASGEPRDPEAIFNQFCVACHGEASPIQQAPKIGDVAAWQPRLAEGMEQVYSKGINGVPGTVMVAKGGCASCSDEEIQATVDYMVERSQ